MFEITGEIPEPIFDEPQEAESLGRTWQALIGSQTLRRRSSARYEKGTGDPPKRHQRGNILKKPGSIFRSGFFVDEIEELAGWCRGWPQPWPTLQRFTLQRI